LASSIAGAVDRRLRTETIEGFGAAGPIHLANDGRIVLARASSSAGAADGRIEAFDPATRTRTTALDSLVEPLAADIAPDGTVCAIERLEASATTARLECSSGLAVDLTAGTPSALAGARADLADIVSDGSGGWIVSDRERVALLHVDSVGTVVVLATVRQLPGLPALPRGLARDGTRLLVATGDQGFADVSTSDRGTEVRSQSLIGGGYAVAIASGPDSRRAVVIVEGGEGYAAYPSTNGEIGPIRLTENLADPRGLVVLPDGRVAVASADRLVIVRPSSAPP
jgi:hypothetical protein